jgi:hypothetical protein
VWAEQKRKEHNIVCCLMLCFMQRLMLVTSVVNEQARLKSISAVQKRKKRKTKSSSTECQLAWLSMGSMLAPLLVLARLIVLLSIKTLAL